MSVAAREKNRCRRINSWERTVEDEEDESGLRGRKEKTFLHRCGEEKLLRHSITRPWNRNSITDRTLTCRSPRWHWFVPALQWFPSSKWDWRCCRTGSNAASDVQLRPSRPRRNECQWWLAARNEKPNQKVIAIARRVNSQSARFPSSRCPPFQSCQVPAVRCMRRDSRTRPVGRSPPYTYRRPFQPVAKNENECIN